MKSLVHTEELCSRSVPLEHAPGAKSLVCIGLKTERSIYNFLKIFLHEIEAAAICFVMERGRRKSQQNSRICVRAQLKLVYPV